VPLRGNIIKLSYTLGWQKRVSCGMQGSPARQTWGVPLTQLAGPQMPSVPLPQACAKQ